MRTWIEAPASAGDAVATVLLDVDDFLRLDGRRLSIGSHGYAQMWDAPYVMLLHRWIMQVPRGTGYRRIVDHINHEVLDCRKSNLRVVTPTESNLNRRVKPGRYPRGVMRQASGRYGVHLKRQGITQHLGTFDTIQEAVAARERARLALGEDIAS